MNVNVQITYGEGDNPAAITKSPTEVATAVLEALGGDPATDSCYVQVSATASISPPLPDPPAAP